MPGRLTAFFRNNRKKREKKGASLVLSAHAVFSADCAKDRGAIEKKVSSGHFPRDLYYVTLREGTAGGLLDIFSGKYRFTLPEQGEARVIAGVSRTYEEATEIAAEIVSSLYRGSNDDLTPEMARELLKNAFPG